MGRETGKKISMLFHVNLLHCCRLVCYMLRVCHTIYAGQTVCAGSIYACSCNMRATECTQQAAPTWNKTHHRDLKMLLQQQKGTRTHLVKDHNPKQPPVQKGCSAAGCTRSNCAALKASGVETKTSNDPGSPMPPLYLATSRPVQERRASACWSTKMHVGTRKSAGGAAV